MTQQPEPICKCGHENYRHDAYRGACCMCDCLDYRPLTAPLVGEPDELAQVASTLQFCKEQLRLCSETLARKSGKIGTVKIANLAIEINDAKHDVSYVLNYLKSNGITPAPVTSGAEDGETPQEPVIPKRVRIVNKDLLKEYPGLTGKAFEVERAYGEYYSLNIDDRMNLDILASRCEPVSDAVGERETK